MSQSNRRPAAARNLGDGFVGVWVAFEDKDRAKALPSARWDPGLKCWRVNVAFEDEARRLVDRLNGSVDGELEEALETMFARLPAELRGPTWKALQKVWHPDAGGNGRASQALNMAWQRVK